MLTETQQQPNGEKLTEDEMNEADKSSSELDKNIHHTKEINKKRRNEGILLCGRKNHRANERLHNRHLVTTINIATGQNDTEIHRKKLTNRYQDVVKNEVNFR